MLKRCLAFFIMLLECQCSLSCLCSVVPQPVRELLCYCHPACGKLSFAELLIKPSMCQTAHQAMFKHVRAALHLPSHCLFSQSLLPLAVITIDICNPYKKRRRPAILSLTDATFPFALQDGKKAAVPKLDELLAPDSDSEEEPDLELQLPANKVKYMVGQGGDKIKYIQRKTKCRIQVKPIGHHHCIPYKLDPVSLPTLLWLSIMG